MMSKSLSKNVTAAVTVSLAFYCAYWVLLSDSSLHFSLSSILAYSHQSSTKEHILILGFIPVYIGAVLFGAAILGIGSSNVLNYAFRKLLS